MYRVCKGCPLRGMCYKGRAEKRIHEVNHSTNGFKKQARELLTSERGMKHRSNRPIEPEAVFWDIKFNHGFRRFRLKSARKVKVEFGFVALTHNSRKYSTILFRADKWLENCRCYRIGPKYRCMLMPKTGIQLKKRLFIKEKEQIGCNFFRLKLIIVPIKAKETDLKKSLLDRSHSIITYTLLRKVVLIFLLSFFMDSMTRIRYSAGTCWFIGLLVLVISDNRLKVRLLVLGLQSRWKPC